MPGERRAVPNAWGGGGGGTSDAPRKTSVKIFCPSHFQKIALFFVSVM